MPLCRDRPSLHEAWPPSNLSEPPLANLHRLGHPSPLTRRPGRGTFAAHRTRDPYKRHEREHLAQFAPPLSNSSAAAPLQVKQLHLLHASGRRRSASRPSQHKGEGVGLTQPHRPGQADHSKPTSRPRRTANPASPTAAGRCSTTARPPPQELHDTDPGRQRRAKAGADCR